MHPDESLPGGLDHTCLWGQLGPCHSISVSIWYRAGGQQRQLWVLSDRQKPVLLGNCPLLGGWPPSAGPLVPTSCLEAFTTGLLTWLPQVKPTKLPAAILSILSM